MPATKKKFNSRFPPARIKKIMQTDEEVGKVAAAVPVLVSKAVEIFMESLLTMASEHASERKARTMTLAHLRHCIYREKQFDFLKDLVANVAHVEEDGEGQESSPGGNSAHQRRPRRGRAGSLSGRSGRAESERTYSYSDSAPQPAAAAQTTPPTPQSTTPPTPQSTSPPSSQSTSPPSPQSIAGVGASPPFTMPVFSSSTFQGTGMDDDDDYDS